jgi:predicted TIM-barrel fold metal-dependent hydrolase
MKIFDVHMHMPRNWEQPDTDPEPMVDRIVEVASAAGITKACMLSGGRFGPGYERAIEIVQKYPDFLIPIAMIDPEEIDEDGVQRLWDMGYRGLKLIGVQRDYDDPDYLPTYGKAEELGMPVIFHMGVIGGGVDYSITHPRRDHRQRRPTRAGRRCRTAWGRATSASRMTSTASSQPLRGSRSSGPTSGTALRICRLWLDGVTTSRST